MAMYSLSFLSRLRVSLRCFHISSFEFLPLGIYIHSPPSFDEFLQPTSQQPLLHSSLLFLHNLFQQWTFQIYFVSPILSNFLVNHQDYVGTTTGKFVFSATNHLFLVLISTFMTARYVHFFSGISTSTHQSRAININTNSKLFHVLITGPSTSKTLSMRYL